MNISVCNMRRTADFDAEMVSQALLGTPVHVLQISDNSNAWPQVQTPDNYTGWVHYAGIKRMSYEEYHAWNVAPKVIVTELTGLVYKDASAKSAVVSDVVAGDRLKFLGKKGSWLKVGFPDGRTGYVNKKIAKTEADWRKTLDQSPEAILKTAQGMLGFPYLWAGMSPKGMDCSGFVRTTLYMHDIITPRDCSQIYLTGERITDRRPRVLWPRPGRRHSPPLSCGLLHWQWALPPFHGPGANWQLQPRRPPVRRLQYGPIPLRRPHTSLH